MIIRLVLTWVAAFVAFWGFFYAADCVAFLQFTSIADWSPRLRFFIFFGSAVFATAITAGQYARLRMELF